MNNSPLRIGHLSGLTMQMYNAKSVSPSIIDTAGTIGINGEIKKSQKRL